MSEQVFTDTQTRVIQSCGSAVVMAVGIVATYRLGWAANLSGLLGVGEALGIVILWLFVATSVVGAAMYALNLVFYVVQVHRHGSPVEVVEEDIE